MWEDANGILQTGPTTSPENSYAIVPPANSSAATPMPPLRRSNSSSYIRETKLARIQKLARNGSFLSGGGRARTKKVGDSHTRKLSSVTDIDRRTTAQQPFDSATAAPGPHPLHYDRRLSESASQGSTRKKEMVAGRGERRKTLKPSKRMHFLAFSPAFDMSVLRQVRVGLELGNVNYAMSIFCSFILSVYCLFFPFAMLAP